MMTLALVLLMIRKFLNKTKKTLILFQSCTTSIRLSLSFATSICNSTTSFLLIKPQKNLLSRDASWSKNHRKNLLFFSLHLNLYIFCHSLFSGQWISSACPGGGQSGQSLRAWQSKGHKKIIVMYSYIAKKNLIPKHTKFHCSELIFLSQQAFYCFFLSRGLASLVFSLVLSHDWSSLKNASHLRQSPKSKQ